MYRRMLAVTRMSLLDVDTGRDIDTTIGAENDRVVIRLGMNTQVTIDPESAYAVCKAVEKAVALIAGRKQMLAFSDNQLRWYASCVEMEMMIDDSRNEDGWKVRFVEGVMFGDLPDFEPCSRAELVTFCVAHNEDAETAAVRIQASLEDPAVLGWPPYSDFALLEEEGE